MNNRQDPVSTDGTPVQHFRLRVSIEDSSVLERDVHPGFEGKKRKDPPWAKRFEEEVEEPFKMPRKTEELTGWL